MSRATSYAMVGVIAFLVGIISVRIVDHSGQQHGQDTLIDGGDPSSVTSREFAIDGMMCEGCVEAITSAIKAIPGVQSAQVSLENKRAVVLADSNRVLTEKIVAAIAAAGYRGRLAAAADSRPAPPATSDGEPKKHDIAAYPAEMNKKFADPEADIEQFIKRFEGESRDIYTKRDEIVRAIGLRAGNTVADIGAGTGLFTLMFAKEVGPKGSVYAVDISPAFLKHIADQAERRGLAEVVTPVLNTQNSAMLPGGAVNVAFICDTYHHFEHPEKMLASVRRSLRPNGRLIIIDFDLRKDSSDFVKQRARAPREVYYREIAAAGFERVEPKGAPLLKDNFYAEFRRSSRDP